MEKQIQLYSLDEKAFYTNEENELNIILSWVKREMEIIKEFTLYNALGLKEYKFEGINDFGAQKYESKFIRKYIKAMMKKNKAILKSVEYKESLQDNELFSTYCNETKIINELAKSKIGTKENTICRELNPNALTDYNKISSFESSFTRDLSLATNEVTTDIFIVSVFHYEVMDQLINNSFTFWGERYIPFTASAGQIRKKKIIFIRESTYKMFSNTIMCGLSIEEINNSEQHGCNVNKFLAYLALIFSSTDKIEGFDINKAIVIEDFETKVNGMVDYIDNKTFEVTPTKMDVPIAHSDGCGWVLPSESEKNFMIRLPWVKGLLTPVDYLEYCSKFNDNNYKVIDIYGKEWDIKSRRY